MQRTVVHRQAKLHVSFQLPGMQAAFFAHRSVRVEVIELEQPELHAFALKEAVQVQHMITGLVVVPHIVSIARLRRIPDYLQVMQTLRRASIDRQQKGLIYRLAPVHPSRCNADGTNQQLLMAGHDIGQVQQAPGSMPCPINMNMHPALMRWVAPCACCTQVADDLLQQRHLLPGKNRADQFRAFPCIASLDGAIRFDFPDIVASRVADRVNSSLIQVHAGKRIIPGYPGQLRQGSGHNLGSFRARDIVHLDLYAELLIQDFVHFFVYLRHFFLDRVYVSSGCLTLQDAKLHKVYTKSLCNLVRLNHSSTVV